MFKFFTKVIFIATYFISGHITATADECSKDPIISRAYYIPGVHEPGRYRTYLSVEDSKSLMKAFNFEWPEQSSRSGQRKELFISAGTYILCDSAYLQQSSRCQVLISTFYDEEITENLDELNIDNATAHVRVHPHKSTELWDKLAGLAEQEHPGIGLIKSITFGNSIKPLLQIKCILSENTQDDDNLACHFRLDKTQLEK